MMIVIVITTTDISSSSPSATTTTTIKDYATQSEGLISALVLRRVLGDRQMGDMFMDILDWVEGYQVGVVVVVVVILVVVVGGGGGEEGGSMAMVHGCVYRYINTRLG